MEKFFLSLLVFVPVAIAAEFLNLPHIAVFILAALAIIPLAKYIGEATDELATYTGPAVGGLLSATFGNATELIIAIFAIKAGLLEVVKASLTGSIIGNLLLVLGAAMLAGGFKHKKQVFNRTSVLASASTLLLAVIALVMPAVLTQTVSGLSENIIEHLSLAVSGLMIMTYVAMLFFNLYTHKHLYAAEAGKEEANWSKPKSIIILLVATALVAWMSEILVGSIEPVVLQLGWTELFVGVVFVAIIGNAAEHTSAITMALKNKMDLALQISIGSATQIALFVAPVLVIISLFFARPMSLVFNTFELVSIMFSIFIANLVVQDGESNWLEGLQLLAAYAIIAAAFFFHP